MRLAHKRNVQAKLQKRIKATVAIATTPRTATPVTDESVVENKAAITPKVGTAAKEKKAAAVLTPKQQQVFDIVAAHADGLTPKAIGLVAGQEDAKAASWATGALKKLLEENLVTRESLSGNKVIYKTS